MNDNVVNTETGNNGLTRLSHFLYWGAGVGVISSLTTLFIVVYLYGQSLGLSTGECTLLSCFMTLLLSQPTGVIGIIAGAVIGAICGFIGHRLHTS